MNLHHRIDINTRKRDHATWEMFPFYEQLSAGIADCQIAINRQLSL